MSESDRKRDELRPATERGRVDRLLYDVERLLGTGSVRDIEDLLAAADQMERECLLRELSDLESELRQSAEKRLGAEEFGRLFPESREFLTLKLHLPVNLGATRPRLSRCSLGRETVRPRKSPLVVPCRQPSVATAFKVCWVAVALGWSIWLTIRSSIGLWPSRCCGWTAFAAPVSRD